MSIAIQKVNKFYGKQQALTDVSFSLKKGEVVGFLGPNGAGKSTLMKIITCYLQQDNGKVHVCDLDTEEQYLQVKEKIGYLRLKSFNENSDAQLIKQINNHIDYATRVIQTRSSA